jgi:hypothetical protein
MVVINRGDAEARRKSRTLPSGLRVSASPRFFAAVIAGIR